VKVLENFPDPPHKIERRAFLISSNKELIRKEGLIRKQIEEEFCALKRNINSLIRQDDSLKMIIF